MYTTTVTFLALLLGTQDLLAASNTDINTYTAEDGKSYYTSPLYCSYSTLYMANYYNTIRSTYIMTNDRNCCYLANSRNKCCVQTDSSGGYQGCKCDPSITCGPTKALPETTTTTLPTTTTTLPTTTTTLPTTTTTLPTTTTTLPTTTMTLPTTTTTRPTTTTTLPTTTTTKPTTTTTLPTTTTTKPTTTTTLPTTTTTLPTTTTTKATTTTTQPTTTTTLPTTTTTLPTTTTTKPTTTTTLPTTTTTQSTTTTTLPTTTTTQPTTTTTLPTTTTTKPTTTTTLPTTTTTKPTTTTTKPTTTTTKPTTTTTKPTTTTTKPTTTTTVTTTTTTLSTTTTASKSLCPSSLSFRILNGDQASTDCPNSDILNVTFLAGEISSCNCVYTYATVNGDVKPTLFTSQTCKEFIDSAGPNDEPYQIHVGGKDYDLRQPAFTTVAGPSGSGTAFIDIAEDQMSIFDDIDTCQKTNARCPYNKATMENRVDFTNCKMYSYGTSNAEEFTQNGLNEVAVAINNGGCNGIQDPYSTDTLCFTAKSGKTLVCSNDAGGPLYCHALETEEWILMGVAGYQEECDATPDIVVLKYTG